MCRRTNAWAAGRKIDGVKVHRQNGKYHVGDITGYAVVGVFRRGKNMIFQLTGDKVLVSHNAMSGYWDAHDDPWTFDYVEGDRKPTEKDVRVELILDGGRRLRFHDSRLFGHMYAATWAEMVQDMNALGPEAIRTERMLGLAPVLNVLDMAIVCDSKKPIKQVLLEQERLAGVGNIYAAEALWRAQIHPLTKAKELGTQELQDITEAIQGVLKSALDRGLDYSGLQVYRRSTCPRCKMGEIGKIEVAKRTTYYCPVCQENG